MSSEKLPNLFPLGVKIQLFRMFQKTIPSFIEFATSKLSGENLTSETYVAATKVDLIKSLISWIDIVDDSSQSSALLDIDPMQVEPVEIPDIPVDEAFLSMLPAVFSQFSTLMDEGMKDQFIDLMVDSLFPSRKMLQDYIMWMITQTSDKLLKKVLSKYSTVFPKAEIACKPRLTELIKEVVKRSESMTSPDSILESSSYDSLGLAGHRTTFRDLMISIRGKRELLLGMDEKKVLRNLGPSEERFSKLILAMIANIKALIKGKTPCPFTNTIGFYKNLLKIHEKSWNIMDIRNGLHNPIEVRIDRESKKIIVLLHLERHDKNGNVKKREDVLIELNELREKITNFCTIVTLILADCQLFLEENEDISEEIDANIPIFNETTFKERLKEIFLDKEKTQYFWNGIYVTYYILLKKSLTPLETFMSKVILAQTSYLLIGDRDIEEKMVDEALSVEGLTAQNIVQGAVNFVLGPHKDNALAYKIVNRAIEIDGNDAMARFVRAHLLIAEEKSGETIQDLELAISKDPAYKERVKNDHSFDNIRENPRFMKLIEDILLPHEPESNK